VTAPAAPADRCDACGFDWYALPRDGLAPAIADLAARHALRLGEHPVAYLRIRPDEATWSALAYGCHVRDVLIVQRERITLALVADTPELEPLGPDRRAADGRYDEADPDAVATSLVAAAAGLGDQLGTLDDVGWARPTRYPYPPPPTVRDVDWIVRNTLHELTHHLADVDRVLDTALAAEVPTPEG
jgi:hypothetical protein